MSLPSWLFALVSILVATLSSAPLGAQGNRLSFEGEARVRYESLDGQFRAGGTGGDQGLFFRTVALAELRAGGTILGLELQDARSYLTDSTTPLSSSFVNPLDVLQAYLRFPLAGFPLKGADTDLRIGRQTVSVGSNRQIERVGFGNVIKSFTGAHAIISRPGTDQLHLLAVVPVDAEPSSRERLDDNDLAPDREQWNRVLVAAHYIREGILPEVWPGLGGELFAYGLREHDSDRFPTPNRRYLTSGVRVFSDEDPGRWDIDVEGAFRFGSRHGSSADADTEPLDVRASMLRAEVGYTLDLPWQPRLALQYYRASGDDDPNDDEFGQFERLFGGRRTDLGNTNLHGPLTPANLSAPGIRFSVVPNDRVYARVTYSAASLASATDRWVVARVHDPTGESGTFIGHAFDGHTRIWLKRGELQLELGASALIFGEFAETAPNGPSGERTLFGYTQLVFTWD